MNRVIKLMPSAEADLDALKETPGTQRILKDVVKAINLMKRDLRHPSLNTHEFESMRGPAGEKVFVAYAQQNTASAYRIFWYYGPERNTVSVIAIWPHP